MECFDEICDGNTRTTREHGEYRATGGDEIINTQLLNLDIVLGEADNAWRRSWRLVLACTHHGAGRVRGQPCTASKSCEDWESWLGGGGVVANKWLYQL